MKQDNTAEKYYRYTLVLSLALSFPFLLFLVPVFELAGTEGLNWGPYISFCIIIFLGYGSLLAYYIYQYVYYKRIKLTEVQDAKLESTDSFFRTIGFNIKVKVGNDEKIKEVTTKHVFFVSGLMSLNSVDDFSGKIAKVGYDENRDQWVVIDVVKEE